jgi:hypothetical protein
MILAIKPSRPIGILKIVAPPGPDTEEVVSAERFCAFVIGDSRSCCPQLEYRFMLEIAQPDLKPALDVARSATVEQASNGIHYGTRGDTQLSTVQIEQMVEAVPQAVAAALRRKMYYFVPLTVPDPSESENSGRELNSFDAGKTMVALNFTTELSDLAVCHRNITVDETDYVFISTRLMQDRFALAFEFYINAGHHFVDAVGVPESFANLAWAQVEAGARGETSQDAWEQRAKATGQPEPRTAESTPGLRTRPSRGLAAGRSPEPQARTTVVDEKARSEYFEAAFADAIAIYLLSLTVDFDYSELREREYPLLAAPALAERLKHVAQLFPPNSGNEFSIRYRRRNG